MRAATPFGAEPAPAASANGALPPPPSAVAPRPGSPPLLPVLPAAPVETNPGETPASFAGTPPDASDPVLLPLAEYTLPQPGEPLPPAEASLDQLLAGAALNSPQMREQEHRVAQFDAARFRSWVRYLPVISASYNVGVFYQANHTGTGRSTAPGGAFTVQATQPLFDWGAYDATGELAKLKEQIAQNDALLAYTRLCLDLRVRYNELIVRQARAALLAQQAQSAARRQERERLLLASGRSTPARLGQIELQAEMLALEQARAANEFQFQVTEFRRLSGAADFAAADVPGYIVMPAVNQPALEERYQDYSRSGYQASLAARDTTLRQSAIDQQLIINDARQKPSFNLSAGLTQSPYDGNNNNGLQFTTFLFAGLSGSWNIFDRYETRDNNRSLLAQRRLVATQSANSRDAALSTATDSLNRLSLGLRAVAMLKRQLALRQDEYRELLLRAATGRTEQTETDTLRDALQIIRFDILQQQAEVANSYHTFLTALFLDPALAHAPQFARPTTAAK